MSKFYICTFGCRCNQADSGAIRESLCRKGLEEAASHSDADLVVVNSCTVTQGPTSRCARPCAGFTATIRVLASS